MDAAVRLYLDEVIAPNRSLPVRGFVVLISLVLAVNLAAGTLFVLMGAPPIPIFLGLDVLGLVLAFRASYRQAHRRERVLVTADQVTVLREHGASRQQVWTSPTAFTRVDRADAGRHGLQVRLRLSARRLTIGHALGPREREGLARALEAAIREARAERYPS